MADVLGPDLLPWNTSFRVKEPDGRGFVSWHQDTTYIRLKPLVCICWLALSPATKASGCLDCIPAHAHQESGRRESAMVPRGVDRYGNFDADPRPEGALTPAALTAHRRAVEGQSPTMYEGAETTPIALG